MEVTCCQTSTSKMFIKSLINGIVISVDHIGVVPWCLIWWFIWFLIHSIYKKLFRLLLRRITIKEEDSQLLVKLYWSIAFTSITVPFALYNLKLSYSDVIDKFYYVLENHISRWFSSEPIPSVQTKLSYVILAGFYLHNICEICLENGLHSVAFIVNELTGIFFISTFPLRCVQFGIAVTTIVNSVDFFLDVSKLFSCFCDIAQTKYLRFLVHLFFLLHCVLWILIYFNVFPMYFIYTSLKKMNQGHDTKQTSVFLLLNGSLIAFYAVTLATSSLTEMVMKFLKSQSLFSRPKRTPIESPLVPEEKMFESERIIKKRENLQRLYQTVKCAIIIKRKLNKMREKKRQTDFASVCEETCSENCQERQFDGTDNKVLKTTHKEDILEEQAS